MKTAFQMRRRLAGGWLAGIWWITPALMTAQTVDIGEFFLVEPGHSWVMEGNAAYSGFSVPVEAVLTTAAGKTLHGTETVAVTLVGEGSAFFQSFKVEQKVEVSLSSTHLQLHSRVGQVYLNQQLKDEDVETYLQPALLLPRLITVGQTYPYQAQLDNGTYDDAVLVESVEVLSTPEGPVETLKLVIFADGQVPVTLWLGRNLGCMQASVATTLEGAPLSFTALLTEMDQPWSTAPVEGIWCDSVVYENGWRHADWLGYFWTDSVNAAWIKHLGLNWAYGMGHSGNLWLYLPGVSWFWTNSVSFPWMYHLGTGKYLRFANYPYEGALWFWDSEEGWVDLDP